MMGKDEQFLLEVNIGFLRGQHSPAVEKTAAGDIFINNISTEKLTDEV